MFNRWTYAGMWVALLIPFLAGAQTKSGPNTSNSERQAAQVIHTTTRLVQVTVIVQDKNGDAITGLKKKDFKLLDEGVPQEIAFFSSTTPAHPAAQALPANVFTNRTELRGDAPGAVSVLLYDSLNTSFEDQIYARQHILRFLQNVLPEDHVAIFALTTELLVLHDFTEDTAALKSSLDRFSPQLLAAFDASHPEKFHVEGLSNDPFWRSFEDRVNNANGEIADSRTMDRLRITYDALLAIANYVESIPGHKSLVWVSGGIPIQLGTDRIGIPDRDNFRFDKLGAPGMPGENNLSGLARELNRVNMAIYPIDAHGVEVDDSAASFWTRQNQRDTFRLLADKTGGKAFYGTNDVASAIKSALEGGRYTYTLGFYPKHGVWDGKFRELGIHVATGGAQLRYRKGYFAFPEKAGNQEIMTADLQEAARSPVDATALGVTVKEKMLPPASARVAQLQITLDPNQFLLQEHENRREGGLDLLFLQKDYSGKFLAAEKQHLNLKFTEGGYERVTKSGLLVRRQLAIDSAAAEIRILVRDAGSGSLGSVTIPVKQVH